MGKTVFRIFQALRAEFAQTSFVIAGLEEPVEEGSKILPLKISVDEDTVITVTGKMTGSICSGREILLCTDVDYKSGSKEFKLDAMAEGLNLQMLLYLFALWKNGREEYQDVTPAGILYMPAGTVTPALPRDAGAEDEQRAVETAYAMNGLLLDDQTVLGGYGTGSFRTVFAGVSGR